MANSGKSIFKLKRVEKKFWESIRALAGGEANIESLLLSSLGKNYRRVLELNAPFALRSVSLAYGVFSGQEGGVFYCVGEHLPVATKKEIEDLGLGHIVAFREEPPSFFLGKVAGKFDLILVHGHGLDYLAVKELLELSYKRLELGGSLFLTGAKDVDVTRAFHVVFSGKELLWVSIPDLMDGTLLFVRTMPQ